jgi:hypothetical protein
MEDPEIETMKPTEPDQASLILKQPEKIKLPKQMIGNLHPNVSPIYGNLGDYVPPEPLEDGISVEERKLQPYKSGTYKG